MHPRERVWVKQKIIDFIAFPGKGGHSRLLLSKLCVLTQGFVEGLIVKCRVADMDHGACRACILSIQTSSDVRNLVVLKAVEL